MSIPPLVCSTPPPPEQCEDDRDQEDFEINYNLSQEDDGNDYDYGKFSTFNNFELNTSKNYQEFATSQISNNPEPKCEHTSVKHIISNETLREDNAIEIIVEDDVIEDLDLKIDHESASNVKNTTEDTTKSKETEPHDVKKLTEDLQEQQTNIPIDSIATSQENIATSQELKLENVNIEHNNVENIEIIQTLNDDVNLEGLPNKVVSEKSSHSDSTVCDNTTDNPSSFGITKYDNLIESINNEEEPRNIDENLVQNDDENKDIEDFEDFDDFQFVGSDKKTEPVIDTALENPWKNDDPQNDSFGEFTANFADSENKSTQSSEQQIHKQHDSDDDFGDFDEFKSVNDNESSQVTLNPCEDVPVLNLHSTDSEFQIIERINKVIHTIFPEEITEPENAFEGKLEVSLGETWGYLMETDVRQPYIVNWNNSLAQKTLLKALCIDSRNILFGPKWSSNMPKYAANLSAATLQPQKQPGQPTITQIDATNSDKATNKPSWTDPFTSDGQESCNTENENAVIETGPTDLDVFEAAMSTKPDKVYSNTLSIQPIRQINLPDTHIFTPTNSEIPRSKTIHYDSTSAPTMILPESVSDNAMTSQTSNVGNDYWEFQDFKGKPVNQVIDSLAKNDDQKHNEDNAVNKGVTLKSNYTLATQVLQPIKLEPIMPTLNWPDPGEVKETFDDFTDFISNSSLSNEKPEAILHSSVVKIELSAAPITLNNNIGSKKNEEKSSTTSDKVDDDFEMFQSAMPAFKNNTRGESSNKDSEANYQNISPDEGSTKLTELDRSLCKDDKIKSENISLSNTKSIDNVFKNVDTTSKINTFKPQQLPSTASQIANTLVLQPTPVTSGVVTKQSQQKAGQILQPLSLESYSQINWPNPGIDLQDLSRFNPVESLQSLKNDSNSHSKTASPVHSYKSLTNSNQNADEDIWGDFVSSKPKQLQALPKKQATFTDDDEWTEFVSSPSVNPQNGLNTISLNVHTNSSGHKSSNSTKYPMKSNEIPLDIPALNYITPKTSTHKSYNDRHFQNL